MKPEKNKKYLIDYKGRLDKNEFAFYGEALCLGESDITKGNYLFQLPNDEWAEFTQEDVIKEIKPC